MPITSSLLALIAVHSVPIPQAPAPNAEMAKVIDQLADYKNPPLPSLPVLQARQLPDASDAYREVLARMGKPGTDPTVDVDHAVIPGPGGKIVVRIYRPGAAGGAAAGPLPVVVYYRGGGWTIASLDTYDGSCRAIAKMTGAMVVSVSYRTSPEAKFPAAHEDAYAALQYVMKNAGSMGGDPANVAVFGESAGGNMASAVCLMANDRKGMLPKHQVLIYPVTQIGTVTESYRENEKSLPLNTPTLMWMGKNYMKSPADAKSKYLSILRAPDADLRRLPPATIILAEIDPLRTEGQMYADKLKSLGVPTTSTLYRGVTHEFFGMGQAVSEAMQAETEAANALKAAFGK